MSEYLVEGTIFFSGNGQVDDGKPFQLTHRQIHSEQMQV